MKPWVRREPVPLDPPKLPAWLRQHQPAYDVTEMVRAAVATGRPQFNGRYAVTPRRAPHKVFVRRFGGALWPWWWYCLRCCGTGQFPDHRSALHHAVQHYDRCILPARHGLTYHPL